MGLKIKSIQKFVIIRVRKHNLFRLIRHIPNFILNMNSAHALNEKSLWGQTFRDYEKCVFIFTWFKTEKMIFKIN